MTRTIRVRMVVECDEPGCNETLEAINGVPTNPEDSNRTWRWLSVRRGEVFAFCPAHWDCERALDLVARIQERAT